MAGRRIEYQFLISGTETAAAKLKAIEGLNQSLSKGISSADLFKATGGNFSSATLAKNKELFAQLGKDAGKSFDSGLKSSNGALAAFLNQSMGIGAGQNRPNRAGYAAFWRSALPPVIAPPIIGGLGGGAGGGGGSFGGLGRFSGNFSPGGFASFGSSVPVVIAALAAFKIAIEATKMAMELFKDAVEKGSKLFEDSAKVGVSTSRLQNYRSALGAIGIDSSTADMLALNSQFGRGQRIGRGGLTGNSTVAGTGSIIESQGMMLSARRVGQFGAEQQIKNLSKYLDEFSSSMQKANEITSLTSKELFEVGFEWKKFRGELQATIQAFASELGIILIPALRIATAFLHQFNATFLELLKILQATGLIAKGGDFGRAIGGGGGNSRIPANAMQRMGFVFGMGAEIHGDVQKNIEKNTKATAVGINQLAKFMGGGGDFGGAGAGGSWATNP